MRSRPGFTLLELLCALGILALLLTIAAPSVSARLPALAADQAARRIASEMTLARLRAISRNARVRVVFDLDARRYAVSSETEDGFAPQGGPRDLPAGVRFDRAACSRVTAGRIQVTFQPRGNTADNSTIALAAAGDVARRVIVSTSGRVRTER